MLSVITLAALAAGSPFLTPGTYQYTATVSGQKSGGSTIAVQRNGDRTEIDEKSTGSFAGVAVAAQATLILGAGLVPSQYTGTYQTGTQNVTVTAALAPDSGTILSSLTGPQPRTVALAAGTRHFVVIEPGLMAGLFALPAQLESWKDAAVTVVVPLAGHAEALPIAVTSPPPRPDGVPTGDAELSFGGEIPFTIWYDPATFIPDAIAVPSQNATVTRIRGS